MYDTQATLTARKQEDGFIRPTAGWTSDIGKTLELAAAVCNINLASQESLQLDRVTKQQRV